MAINCLLDLYLLHDWKTRGFDSYQSAIIET